MCEIYSIVSSWGVIRGRIRERFTAGMTSISEHLLSAAVPLSKPWNPALLELGQEVVHTHTYAHASCVDVMCSWGTVMEQAMLCSQEHTCSGRSSCVSHGNPGLCHGHSDHH